MTAVAFGWDADRSVDCAVERGGHMGEQDDGRGERNTLGNHSLCATICTIDPFDEPVQEVLYASSLRSPSCAQI